MSLNSIDISKFVACAREIVRLIDATTIAITDVPAIGQTRNQLAALINRYHSETPNAGTPPDIAAT